MYHFTAPPTGLMVNLPSAIASANGPHAAALSLSDSDSLTANQLQNQVTQARRARDKLIDQITKPPEPGWKSAVNQVSETVERMEKVLSFLQAHSVLPVRPVEDLDSVEVYPSGTALQQSGRTSDAPPPDTKAPVASQSVASQSVASSPVAPPANEVSATEPVNSAAAGRAPGVIYVMDDGVVIVGLPPEETARTASRHRGTTDAPLQPTPAAEQAKTPGVVVNLSLTEDQQRASQDLIALARKAYAQLQPHVAEQSADLITSTQIGITAELEKDPAAPPSPERITPAAPLREPPLSPPTSADTTANSTQKDPLHATAAPFASDASEEAAEATRQQQVIALQLDGHNDIIYIVPPAKATMDLIA
ncbi:MAG: hypothetical protein BM562_10720 [Alphaproteobacteria bacterium MedPE-SWcel]|nr:MAG: hypothetical protein BM562_10720 [Alphaproteobacteria bacterium MedPE-SWcel]